MSEPAISLDNIFKIVEIASLLGGGVYFAFKVGKTSSRFEAATAQHSEIIRELRADIKELNKIVAGVALFNERMNLVANRLDLLDKRYEELRHGEGFTFPLDSHLRG